MWKVLVIFCFLRFECILLEEKPMNYYTTETECVNIATLKMDQLHKAYSRYGYIIEDSKALCEKVPII